MSSARNHRKRSHRSEGNKRGLVNTIGVRNMASRYQAPRTGWRSLFKGLRKARETREDKA